MASPVHKYRRRIFGTIHFIYVCLIFFFRSSFHTWWRKRKKSHWFGFRRRRPNQREHGQDFPQKAPHLPSPDCRRARREPTGRGTPPSFAIPPNRISPRQVTFPCLSSTCPPSPSRCAVAVSRTLPSLSPSTVNCAEKTLHARTRSSLSLSLSISRKSR